MIIWLLSVTHGDPLTWGGLCSKTTHCADVTQQEATVTFLYRISVNCLYFTGESCNDTSVWPRLQRTNTHQTHQTWAEKHFWGQALALISHCVISVWSQIKSEITHLYKIEGRFSNFGNWNVTAWEKLGLLPGFSVKHYLIVLGQAGGKQFCFILGSWSHCKDQLKAEESRKQIDGKC